MDRLWLRGGFPPSFLAACHGLSLTWRENFIRTFVERDLPQLGIRVPAFAISRFWAMLTHYHGQIWNSSEFARSFGVTDKSVRHYLDILNAALVVQVVPPWHSNVKKRQVKSPKIFIRDSWILHALLGQRDRWDLERHPKVGASWEGFVLQQVMEHLGARQEDYYFCGHSSWERNRPCLGQRPKTLGIRNQKDFHAKIDRLHSRRARNPGPGPVVCHSRGREYFSSSPPRQSRGSGLDPR